MKVQCVMLILGSQPGSELPLEILEASLQFLTPHLVLVVLICSEGYQDAESRNGEVGGELAGPRLKMHWASSLAYMHY